MEIFSLGPDEDMRTCQKLVSLNKNSPVNEKIQDTIWKNRMRNLHLHISLSCSSVFVYHHSDTLFLLFSVLPHCFFTFHHVNADIHYCAIFIFHILQINIPSAEMKYILITCIYEYVTWILLQDYSVTFL